MRSAAPRRKEKRGTTMTSTDGAAGTASRGSGERGGSMGSEGRAAKSRRKHGGGRGGEQARARARAGSEAAAAITRGTGEQHNRKHKREKENDLSLLAGWRSEPSAPSRGRYERTLAISRARRSMGGREELLVVWPGSRTYRPVACRLHSDDEMAWNDRSAEAVRQAAGHPGTVVAQRDGHGGLQG